MRRIGHHVRGRQGSQARIAIGGRCLDEVGIRLTGTGLANTISLDRSYDYPKIRAGLAERGLTELDIQRRGTKRHHQAHPIDSPSGCGG